MDNKKIQITNTNTNTKVKAISPPLGDKIKSSNVNKNLKDLNSENLSKIKNKIVSFDKLYNKIDTLKASSFKLKITIAIIFLVIIVSISICVYYFYYNNNPINNIKVYIETQKSTNKFIFDGDFIDPPNDGFNYSISFWLYINDYYEEYTYWRHILHKGHEPIIQYGKLNNLIEYKSWEQLTQEFKEQSPGIWLHPNKNNIRLAFTTEIKKDYCSSNFSENTCLDKEYCKWDNLHCKLKNEHAFTNDEVINYRNRSKTIIEHIDLENIPIKTMIFIAFSFEQKNLNIYMNGKLHKTKRFLGVPVFNKDKMFFNLKNTFNGSIFKFRYIPLSLKSSDLLTFYHDIPNVKYFPKKFRIEQYAKQMNIKEMISAILN